MLTVYVLSFYLVYRLFPHEKAPSASTAIEIYNLLLLSMHSVHGAVQNKAIHFPEPSGESKPQRTLIGQSNHLQLSILLSASVCFLICLLVYLYTQSIQIFNSHLVQCTTNFQHANKIFMEYIDLYS